MALVAASSLLLAVSCQKEMPGTVEVSEKGKTFTATIEQSFTKTTLSYDPWQNESKVMWESGDCININGSGYGATPLTPATKAIFKDKWWGDEPTAPYHAIFPASLHNGSGFEFPASQEYADGKFNAPMYAESSTEVLPFKNICGVLCFSLTGEDKVKRISVTANEPLCGAFTVNDGYEVNLTGTGKTVTLYCGQQGVQLDAATPTDFYIYLPPGKYTSGMRITITNSEEDVFEKITTVEADVARSTVYDFVWDVTFSPALTGRFSVGEDRTVSFSRGNLHATKVGENWITGFYERQNEFSPIATVTNSTVNGARTASLNDREIDLFTWGYGSAFTTDPTTLSYGQPFSDWGTQIGSGTGWRTLSSEEWDYLLEGRSNAAKLYKSGVTVCGVDNCLVIAPDGFAGQIAESYDAAGWSTSEKTDGLVCLPPAGHRYGADVGGSGERGFYWTSTATGAAGADVLSLNNDGQGTVETVLEEVCNNIESKTMSGWCEGSELQVTSATEEGVACYKISHPVQENDWQAQIQYSGNAFTDGTRYTLSVKAKVSSGTYAMKPLFQVKYEDGGGECAFPNLNLTTEWQEFKISFTNWLDNCSILTFNIGDYAGDVYIAYVKLEKEVTPKSTIENRILQGFPNGTGFSWGPGETFSNSQEMVDGKYCHIMNNTVAGELWSAKYQINCDPGTFEAGQRFRVRMTVKAESEKAIQWQLLRQEGNDYPSCGLSSEGSLTTEWQDLVLDGICTDGGATSISFQFGDYEGKIWIAQVSVYNLVEIPYAASTSDGVGTAANDRKYGLSVRLVRDSQSAANLNSLNDDNNYGNLFN